MSDGEGFLSRWSRRKAQRDVDAPTERAAPAASPAAVPEVAGRGDAPDTPALAGRAGARERLDSPAAALPPAAAAEAPVAGSANATPATPANLATPAAAPPPTLDDVAGLTRDSDYAPFVARQVDPQVRNAAMKKLFSDPHFNVMDGLDTYIDDYGKPDPLPLAMIRQMTGARALGLFAEEEAAEAKALADAAAAKDAAASAGAGATTPANAEPTTPDAVHCDAGPDGAPAAPLAQFPIAEPEAPHEDTDLRLQPDHAARRPGVGEGPGPGQG
jgi:hypothetical protein